MKKKIEFEVSTPPVPKVLVVDVVGKDGDGFPCTVTREVPLSEYTDAELRAVAKQWTELLLLEAAKQRQPGDEAPKS